ncbi:hypothetical protein ABPG72_003493 [Tetrahymena utriculariae]
MINNTKNELSADQIKYLKMMQDHKYINRKGITSHALDLFFNPKISLSTREPKKLIIAEKIIQNQNNHNPNLQIQKIQSQDFQDHKDLNIIQYDMHKEYNNEQSIEMEQNNKVKETQQQETEEFNDKIQQKQNSFNLDIFIKASASKPQQKEKEALFVKQQQKENTFIQNNDQIQQSTSEKIHLDFQQLQNSKLKEYQQLEEKKKYCELDKKQVKREKYKYQKFLHYYQTLISKLEQQVLELAQQYTFLENNETVNNILDIEDEESQSFNEIEKQQEQGMCNNYQFNDKQQKLSGQTEQNDEQSLRDEQSVRDFSYDQNVSHNLNKNQKELSYTPAVHSYQSLKDIQIQDYSDINLTNINTASSQLNKKFYNTTRSENTILQLKKIFQKYIEDITKYICSKKIKINGKSHVVYVVDAKKVIEKSLQQSKRLFKNDNNHYVFVILRLKQIKKCLIQKQDDCLEKLDELFKVNFWPKEYKYTREKGSQEKQKQIQDEIEKNKPLLYQNKQFLLDISKKKFEMKKENPQKKREIQKLENYLIKRHQDERKLSKKLQLHNQMKNFIMYSIRYVADNIAYDDPQDVDRQKKILKCFHLAYNKSDLQALVSPQVPYTIQNIQNIISLDDQKVKFKYNQFFDYQKQMISQYSQYLLEQNSQDSENKQIQVSNLTWKDLLNYPQILEKFNIEIARLNMFNKYNRIFMQRFCLYEYHKIILKGKGNKIDHFYGNNFILSALSNPKIIQL